MSTHLINLLLVEDNPGDVRLVREMLAEAGSSNAEAAFKITHKGRLDQALAAVNTDQFDLVLLDLSLPDSHGLETFYQMLNAVNELPLVILSGLGDEKVAVEAVHAGAQDYLVKGSMNEFSLPRAIRYAIERNHTERDLRRRNRALALLNKIIAASAVILKPEEILEIACKELAETFDMPRAVATLLNDDKTNAVVVAQYSAQEEFMALGITISLTENPALQRLLNYQGPLMITDTRSDLRLTALYNLLDKFGVVSLLVLPLRIRDEVIGSLSLQSSVPRAFSTEELDLAWSVADQVALSLARVKLDQERQLLSTAVNKTAENVIITDADGTIVYVNQAFEHTTGYTRAEAVGHNPRLLKSGHQPPEFYHQLWTTIKNGQVWHGRFVNQKKDGTLYTEDATITPVSDSSGQIVNFVAVKRDITNELQREAQYLQAQKMEAIGRLAGGVAHDFNNLLTVITGYAEISLLNQTEPDDPLQKNLEEIVKASERAANLTRQLLAFSRKQIIQPVALNLNDSISDISKMLQRLIGEDVELVTLPGKDLGTIKADPGQIEQILMNLAINSRDAMPHGGKLTIETANVYLDQTYTSQHIDVKPGQYVLLAVSDTGIGMDAETQARIFEPFFTTKDKEKGTGLGLATVYGIVKQNSGHVWVYSELGRGTTFKVYLPQFKRAAILAGQQYQTQSIADGTETILVIEDEAPVRKLVYYTLQEKGYTVLEAENGHEAVQLCRQYQEPIHLILTDVVMPGGLVGSQLIQQLLSLHPEMKVLYMSGYPDRSIIHHGILADGSAFLQKPFTPTNLTRKVRTVLDG
ncbi:MAG: Sensor histidine kinase RcsC [Anaerolineae bacterium]|nr:Sensor histidine kinase RcsC [Anaerolineae bacterium]